jgi:hypothetical protein
LPRREAPSRTLLVPPGGDLLATLLFLGGLVLLVAGGEILAAARRQTDVAAANMIGANVFNLLGILGVTALVAPIRVSPSLAGADVWWMLGTAAFLLPVLYLGRRISRLEGGF